jgi:hypothetical protein
MTLSRITTTLRRSTTTGVRSKSTKSADPVSTFTAASSDFWGALRRKAAAALTSSLSPAEQQELLQKVGIFAPATAPIETQIETKDNEDDLTMKHTIAEAVAQARIEEASQQEDKWKKEKEIILSQAERAAMERVRNELSVQKFQAWQEEAHKAKAMPTIETKAEEQTDAHPILGTAVVDLGYKRIHLASAEDLAGIKVWEKQRIYRHSRAKAMAQDKMKTLHLGLPGIIGLHEVRIL